ncbi:hypothetical protein BGP_6361 [Beggiatoa sp. PS]|nr:hypothetical protein BGP_6361 [Beggiatoa sp. PS]
MSYTFEDFERDFTREHIHLLPVEERLKGVSIEERLKDVYHRRSFQGNPREVIEEYLSKDKPKS